MAMEGECFLAPKGLLDPEREAQWGLSTKCFLDSSARRYDLHGVEGGRMAAISATSTPRFAAGASRAPSPSPGRPDSGPGASRGHRQED